MNGRRSHDALGQALARHRHRRRRLAPRHAGCAVDALPRPPWARMLTACLGAPRKSTPSSWSRPIGVLIPRARAGAHHLGLHRCDRRAPWSPVHQRRPAHARACRRLRRRGRRRATTPLPMTSVSPPEPVFAASEKAPANRRRSRSPSLELDERPAQRHPRGRRRDSASGRATRASAGLSPTASSRRARWRHHRRTAPPAAEQVAVARAPRPMTPRPKRNMPERDRGRRSAAR